MAFLHLAAAIGALLFGLTDLGREWAGPLRPLAEISLSPRDLPRYTLYSLFRGFAAYFLSLVFTLVYGYIAAKSVRARKRLSS